MDVRVAALIALNPEFFERMNILWQKNMDIEDARGAQYAHYSEAWNPIEDFLDSKGVPADHKTACARKLTISYWFRSKRAEWLKEKRDEKGKEASEEGKSDEQRNEAV